MPNRILSPQPLRIDLVGLVRPLAGILIAYAGLSLFNQEALANDIIYFDKDLGFPIPEVMVYLARSTEFFGGILLAIGLFTRPAAALLAFVMFVATFFASNGDIFSDGGYQSTAMLIIFIIYFFVGGGRFSVDYALTFLKRNNEKPKAQ